MDISQLAQELLDKDAGRVSVAVKVCVDRAKAPRITGKYSDDDDMEDDDDDEPIPAKGKMAAKSDDDDDDEDVYVDELDDSYEVDLDGKKPAKR